MVIAAYVLPSLFTAPCLLLLAGSSKISVCQGDSRAQLIQTRPHPMHRHDIASDVRAGGVGGRTQARLAPSAVQQPGAELHYPAHGKANLAAAARLREQKSVRQAKRVTIRGTQAVFLEGLGGTAV